MESNLCFLRYLLLNLEAGAFRADGNPYRAPAYHHRGDCVNRESPSENPSGISPFSPRLRGTSCLGSTVQPTRNPNRVCTCLAWRLWSERSAAFTPLPRHTISVTQRNSRSARKSRR